MTAEVVRRAADATMNLTQYALQTSIAGEVVKIPTDCLDNFMDFQAEGEAVYVRFGTSASMDVPDLTALSTLDGSLNPSAVTGGCYFIPADCSIGPRVPHGATHFAHRSAAATGILRFSNSTGPGL